MKTLKERRIRSGRYEWRCGTCGRWYWKLGSHIRRFHSRLSQLDKWVRP